MDIFGPRILDFCYIIYTGFPLSEIKNILTEA